mmetsp:Transcript_2014/g.4728  ORF Transcript_2014/g.4728 Transcript_2014/m.4728 type:complete len:137 (-) Transcript_2014:63-473(-)
MLYQRGQVEIKIEERASVHSLRNSVIPQRENIEIKKEARSGQIFDTRSTDSKQRFLICDSCDRHARTQTVWARWFSEQQKVYLTPFGKQRHVQVTKQYVHRTQQKILCERQHPPRRFRSVTQSAFQSRSTVIERAD